MRRKDREITDKGDMICLLDSQSVLRLALVDGDKPYILPMNFGYTWENEHLTLYFHSAKEGRKFDILERNPAVCFELDCEHRLVEGKLPCQYTYEFASLVGEGRAQMVESPEEKIEAMKVLMKHVSGKDFDFNEKLVSVLAVIKVEVDSFTGKRRKLPTV